VNGDGKPDLISANTYGHTLSILLGKGDGTFESASNYITDTGQWGPYSVLVGDFHGTKILDLVFTDFSDHAVGLFPGNGDGSFQGKQTFPTGEQPFELV